MTRTLEIFDGDVIIGRATGRLRTIANKPKARQHLKRLLELRKPWGAGIETHVGKVPASEFELSADVQRDIREAFDRLARAYTNYQLAERTADERLVSLARIYVLPARISGQLSKTGYAIRVDALTAQARDNTVTQTGLLTTPQGG